MLKQSSDLMEGEYGETSALRVINRKKGGLVELTNEQRVVFNAVKSVRSRAEALGVLGSGREEETAAIIEQLLQLGLIVDDENASGPRQPDAVPNDLGTFKARALYLFLSDACNMDCAHCYVPAEMRHDHSRIMSFDLAKKTIDDFFQQAESLGSKEVELRFLGGEPFFDRKLLLQTLKYAEDEGATKGIGVKFVINTNGTYCDERTVESLKPFADKLFMIVSLDGDEETHNVQRPLRGNKPSYNIVTRNIKRLKEAGIYVCPHVVVSSRNQDQVVDIMDHAKNEFGINQLSYSFMHLPDPTKDIGVRDLSSEEKMQVVRATHAKAKESGMELTGHWKFSIAQSVTNSPALCEGGVSTICVTSNGDMFACQRHVGDPNKKLGNVADGLAKSLGVLRNQKLGQWLNQMSATGERGCVGCMVSGECASKKCSDKGEKETPLSVGILELQAYANQAGAKADSGKSDDDFHEQLLRFYLENCPTAMIRTTEFDTIVNGMQPR
ncbi:MAG: radical SAM protein [Candidatus Gracilibacteria bacterium]